MGPVATSAYPLHSSVSGQAAKEVSFTDRLALLLARTECRRADSSAERNAIFRLRYEAYEREGAIEPNSSGRFTDPFDETGNVYIFGLHVDGELSGAIRLHIASNRDPEFPTGEVFPEQLLPEIEAGRVIVDVTRFVADWRLARVHRGLPYITLRIAWLAAEYFGGDHILAAVRLEHQAFYRRAFNFHLACGVRLYPLLTKPVGLMMLNFPTARDYMYRRYPFFHSTVAERRALLERGPARELLNGTNHR
jgi:N-acyl-L-homoserine lactone synthetase